MAEETLLSAARRLARFLRIDLANGGIVRVATQQAIDTLDIQVDREAKRQKAAEPEAKP